MKGKNLVVTMTLITCLLWSIAAGHQFGTGDLFGGCLDVLIALLFGASLLMTAWRRG